MLKQLAVVLLITGALGATPGQAAWSGFQTMGTTKLVGDISCAGASPGVVYCAARDIDNHFVTNSFSETFGWSGWTATGIAATSNPSCADDGTGTGSALCAVRDGGGELTGTYWANGAAGAVVHSGQRIATAPSCTPIVGAHITEEVGCAARNASGTLLGDVFSIAKGTWERRRTPRRRR